LTIARALLLVATALVAITPAPRARADTPSYAIEGDLTGALTKVSPFDKGPDLSHHNGGAGLALTVLLRSPYFLMPFVDVSYVPLERSQAWANLGPYGGAAVVTSSLHAFGVLAGPAIDVWRLRIKTGIGVYDTIVHASVLHQAIAPSELDLGYMFALSGWALRVPTGTRVFKVGLELRLGLITEAAKNFASFGATITEDAIAW
jgi:hypothetical protein